MDTVHATVIGPCAVLGITLGATVKLDPTRYNVAALVDAGHIELTEADPDDEQTGFEVSGG